jgi:C1A family cysteine protease
MQACYKNAAQHVVLSNQRITCLAAGYPFFNGFTVNESFESPDVAHTGVVPLSSRHEKVIGGHAAAATGYDDATQ